MFCKVISNKTDNTCEREVLYPVCYERINIFEDEFVDEVRLEGPTYIMPAGYRSGEWYAVNRFNLNGVDLIGCLDNDQNKVGSSLLDKSIYEAQQVLEKKERYNLILCTKYYQDEIRKQIAHNASVCFLDADTILWVDKESVMYVFSFEKYKNMSII